MSPNDIVAIEPIVSLHLIFSRMSRLQGFQRRQVIKDTGGQACEAIPVQIPSYKEQQKLCKYLRG